MKLKGYMCGSCENALTRAGGSAYVCMPMRNRSANVKRPPRPSRRRRAAEPPAAGHPASRTAARRSRGGRSARAGCGKDAVPQARARPAYAARRYSTNAMTNAAPSPAGAEPGHEPGAPTGAPGGPPRALRPAGTRVFPAVTHRGAYRYL